jgi:cell division septal protein FtsQ
MRARVLESSWVAEARLHRVLPSTIEIRVTERQPIGITRIGRRLHLIDRTGAIIDEFGPRYVEFDLPMIDGLVRTGKGRAPAVDPDRAALAARFMDAVAGKAVGRRLSQVDVTNLRDVVVLLDDDDATLHLGHEHFAERLQAYVEVAAALREQVAAIDYVDLRLVGTIGDGQPADRTRALAARAAHGERIYVKPRGRGAVARAARPATGRQF